MTISSLQFQRRVVLAALPIFLAWPATAFDTFDVAWPSGDVTLVLDLDNEDAPSGALNLNDGSTSWNQVAAASLAEWNTHLNRTMLVAADPDPSRPADLGNGQNDVFFSETVYGDEFGESTLALTLLLSDPTNFSAIGEADIIVNLARSWNAYRGTAQFNVIDLRRVMTHEMGHLLGLDHPDQATPVQFVDAIMNSTVGDIDRLQEDDIAGVDFLYGTPLITPIITAQTPDLIVDVGEVVTIDVEIGGQPTPVVDDLNLSIDWFYPDANFDNFPDNFLFIEDSSRLFIGLAQTYDSGAYTLITGNPDGRTEATVNLTVNPIPTSPLTQLANLSTRGFSGDGDRAMTVGFVIEGDEPLNILLRAVGPTIAGAPFNVPGTMPDPILSLRRALSTGGFEDVATNDNWHQSDLATPEQMEAVAAEMGAFALNENSADAALLISLNPGIYTATVTGAEDDDQATEGVIIVEAYDVDTTGSGSRLVNLSTRGFVTNNDSTMIAGLVVKGTAARTYMLRVAGDTLGDFGVSNPVDDPFMTLFRGTEAIRINDDWDHPPAHQDLLRTTMNELGAFALTDRQECAMLLTLEPGPYTLRVEGFDENSEGIGLIEFYEVPE